MYISIIVIRGPQVHQSLTGEFDLYVRAERRTYYHNRMYTYVVYGTVSLHYIYI